MKSTTSYDEKLEHLKTLHCQYNAIRSLVIEHFANIGHLVKGDSEFKVRTSGRLPKAVILHLINSAEATTIQLGKSKKNLIQPLHPPWS